MRFCGRRLLFKCMPLADRDRSRRRTEACRHLPDPVRGVFAEPAAMLTAIGAAQRSGVWLSAGTDDADVTAARALAVDGAIKLDLETNDAHCWPSSISGIAAIASCCDR